MPKKILGLDLGTSSVGWAFIETGKNERPDSISGMGVRIIPLTTDERDQFQRGQAITKNQDRTRARTQRKGYKRRRIRKNNLYSLLKELAIEPAAELVHIPAGELWKLRSDAAGNEQPLSPAQLGRVLCHINQKRGYKSARKEENKDMKDTEYVAEVKERHAGLKANNETIGQFFYREMMEAKLKNRHFQVKKKVYPREAYLEEFDAIMKVQQQHHSFLTEAIINRLRNEIIFFQRRLKSQKDLVSICELEGFTVLHHNKETGVSKEVFAGPKVAPRSSPLVQLSKIWESVNNISLKVKNPPGSKYRWSDRSFSGDEKRQLAAALDKREVLSFAEILRITGLKKEDVFANKQVQKGIQGNITKSILAGILGDSHPLLSFNIETEKTGNEAVIVDKSTGEILHREEGLQIGAAAEREPLYQLWHTIYSIADKAECKKALIKRFGIPDEEAEQLADIDFTRYGYSNKSVKAVRKILPWLMQGFQYADACSLAGYNHSNSLTKTERAALKTKDRLSLLPKNSLRQPVVERILNQMINVVNAVIGKYGKPDEIRVELSRELKQSKDERNEADLQNSFNKKLNQEVVKRLEELGVPATRKFIQKYKFIFPARDKKWREAQTINQCIYCGKSFQLTEALTGDNFDVDHIIPQALLFDDSQTNKVLVHRGCNADKTNKTAYDFIAARGEQQLTEYLARVDDWFRRGIISYSKMERLKTSHEAYLERKAQKKQTAADIRLWENFIDRQLRETQYISRKAREILEQVCPYVHATEGGVTAKLRECWGWDDVLMNLQLPKYRGTPYITMKEWTSQHGRRKHKKEEIAGWTKRDDHRHHAIDALVVACTRQGYIQRINTLNASEVRDAMRREMEDAGEKYNERLTLLENYLAGEKPFSADVVGKEAARILISHKAGKKVATISRYRAEGKNKTTGVVVPRGALHEQFVYGKIKVADPAKPLKYLVEHPDLVIDPAVREQIRARLAEHAGDAKKAIQSIRKNPILQNDSDQPLEKADCFREEYVIKYKLQELKAGDIDYIVDKGIREIVRRRLEQFGGNAREAFKEPVWLNEEKGIPIITVRCFTDLKNVEALRLDAGGRETGFVKSGNNHHIGVYRDAAGKLVTYAVKFRDAVERKKMNVPVVIKDTRELWTAVLSKELPPAFMDKLPPDNLQLHFSMQQNEMFLLGMAPEDADLAIREKNTALLSNYLYLVWSISEGDFWFRHHLETKNSELKGVEGARESKRFYRFKSLSGLLKENPVKVRLNHLGEITKVGE